MSRNRRKRRRESKRMDQQRHEQSYEDFVRRALAAQGWYMHMVDPDQDCAGCGRTAEEHAHDQPIPWPIGLMNYNTQAIQRSFNHPDFQIVLAIRPEIANGLFAALVERIKGGERFEPGIYTGITTWGDKERQAKDPMRIRLTWANEEGRQVLRVLLPDPAGLLPGEPGCDPMYQAQDGFDSNKQPDEDPPEKVGELDLNTGEIHD